MNFFKRLLKKKSFNKPVNIMKLTIILLLFCVFHASADGFGQQTLTLKYNNTGIADVLNSIEKQTSYRFLYNTDLPDLKKKISINVQDAGLKNVLDQLFQGTMLAYQFMENNLVIIKSIAALDNDIKAVVTGRVTGENGVSLSGVSVQIKGTGKGVVTGADGNYSINASDNDVLVFSYIGYGTQEIPVTGKTEINITLVAANAELTQVVVIGYGTQRKRDLTGSIAVVSGDVVSKMPSTNPVASLQGKVAGLTIVNTGQAGSSPTVRIRGVNSTNNADPLYVVDGIQQTNIDYLNQADIETIEVLKDPSSISIYGLQGGNGVIIITTKRAKKGQTTINFQSNTGVQHVTHKISVVDAGGFKKLYAEQLNNLDKPAFDFSRYDSAGGNTDWQDQIFRSAILTSNSISVSSSTEKTTTYLNIGYSDQEGVVKYDHYQKYVARLNEEVRLTNNIRVGGEIGGYYFKQSPPVGGIENEALWAAPIIPVQADNGYYYATPSFQSQVTNPVALINEDKGHTLNSGYRFIGNIFAEIKFLKHFTWKSAFYTDLQFSAAPDDNIQTYSGLPFNFIRLGEDSNQTHVILATDPNNNYHTAVSQSSGTFKTYQQDHTLTFDQTFGGHHVTALAGFSTLYHYNDFIYGNRTDTTLHIPDNPIFYYINIVNPSNPGNYGGGGGEDASESYIGRVNYTFKNKYLLNLSYRRDGTSKFSPSHQWGNFGSIGAGWVVSDEGFMQGVKFINFLKLKGSWGTVGNGLSIGNYLSYPVLVNSNAAVFGNNIFPSVTPQYTPDPNLHWEKVEGKDLGFELRAIQNKLSLDVDFYDRKTHDILTYITVPGSNTPYFTNLGTIDNKGVEITAGWTQRIGRDFNISVNGNFSINENKVVSIGNDFNFEIDRGDNQTINRTVTGYSIGYFYGYVQTGIYQDTIKTKSPYFEGAQPGDISYADLNHDDTINTKDRTYIGTPFPKYNYGVSISLSYKNFDFLIEGQGVSGNDIYLQRRTYHFADLNYESNRLNAWTGPGTSNAEPLIDPSRNTLFSTYLLESGSYFRLRTIQIGYTFKSNQIKYIKQLRVYVSGQNIKTFTKATGYSPEVPISTPTNAGADNGTYPLPAIYSIGINLTL